MVSLILLFPTVILSVGLVSHANQSSTPCPQPVPYIEKADVIAPIPYQQVSVSTVAGQISGAIVGTPKGIPRICIGLFTERGHKLFASVVTDEAGGFQFGDVPAGNYRMVIRAPGFFVAEIPVHVLGRSKGKAKVSKPIDVLLQSVALER